MPSEIWPNEGLDIVLEIFPRGGANLSTTFLSLFTTFTATTVGTANQTASAYTEPNFGAYARQQIIASSWGVIAQASGGRASTAGQVTYPTATSNSSAATNGFWLANASTSGKTLFAANFDDDTAVTINTNDVIKVTPTAQYNN